jgi:hypothetical protein
MTIKIDSSEKFSQFLFALGDVLKAKDQDFRTLGQAKRLHSASEALGFDNWQQCSAAFEKRPEDIDRKPSGELEQLNRSVIKELVYLEDQAAEGLASAEDTGFYGKAVNAVEVAFVIGSGTHLFLTIDKSQRVVAGRVVTTGFDCEAVTHLTGSDLEKIANLFDSELVYEAERLGL